MGLPSDIRAVGAALYFLPVETRVPLKFGSEVLRSVTCARVRLRVKRIDGTEADGWGETPLSVQWVWPSEVSYQIRHEALKGFCEMLAGAWANFDETGHAFEIGHAFMAYELPLLLKHWNASRPTSEAMPWLAALVCCSAFDLALHDAFGRVNAVNVYETYNGSWMNRDLGEFLTPADDRKASIDFKGKWPADFFRPQRRDQLLAWHLVGGLDPLSVEDLRGDEPADGHPVLLADWIERDGLKALKIKLRGNDAAWDYERIVRVGRLALRHDVLWLTADFNCTVTDPEYVTEILDRLRDDEPRLFAMLLYVEQPFPYELDEHPIAVHAVAARRPIFLDESAHDWRNVRTGRALGWSGVALKTCKTQTGALLSMCWAQAHGMTLMVQDLTNPMLAQIPHCLLAAHAPTIAGVETNAMQFYPEASAPEARVHPGIYRRRDGRIDLSSVRGAGFGYRLDEIQRELPKAVVEI
jgi:L-alanine-DL-glutamate epimerase-like enolase superfamily enzyme